MHRIATAVLLLPLLAACDGGTEPDDSVIVLRPEPTAVLEAYPLDTIAETLVVRAFRITEAGEEPAAGVEIGWSSEQEMGAIVPAATVTDADGYARARWVLGAGSGPQQTTARVLNGTATTRFDANARRGLVATTLQHQVYSTHACAANAEGEAWCWGTNHVGQLGTGNPLDEVYEIPQRVVGATRFAALDGMAGLSCGLTAAGELWCWGQSHYGWLGGEAEGSGVPKRLAPEITFQSLSMADDLICGIDVGNLGYCWGQGMMGNGVDDRRNISNTPLLIDPESQWSEIALEADWQAFGVTVAGDVLAWGTEVPETNFTFYGVEQQSSLPSPSPVSVVSGLSNLATTETMRCGLEDGSAICWGWVGPDGEGPGPVTINPPSGTFVQLAGDGNLIAGLTSNGEVYSWNAVVPLTRHSPRGPWTAISAGIESSFCAILAADSTVYCWPYRFDDTRLGIGLGAVRPKVVPAPDSP